MLSALVGWTAIAVTLGLAPFFGYLGVLAMAALIGRTRRPIVAAGNAQQARCPRFAIVIPAHNEEEGIATTIASCLAIDYEPDRFTVFVIADNCSDATATAARIAGATVVERFDDERRSKGYALEYFFERADGAWPGGDYEAAVVIDADTVVDSGLLRVLAAVLASGCDWAQLYYTVSNPDASWRTRLMTYALSLFNGVLPLGQDRLGLGVGLKGNGMVLSARGLARFPWRAYGLVEDAEFGLMLKVAGERVRFVPDARVYGAMVRRGAPAVSQRRRWESGRRIVRRRFTGPLIRSTHLNPISKLAYLIDLWLPPLTTLIAAFAVLIGIHPLSRMIPGISPYSAGLVPWHFAMGLVLVLYALSPCLALGLPARYLSGVVYLPYFVIWKFLVVGTRSPSTWVRTTRETSDVGVQPQKPPGSGSSPGPER
jgi:cellulose synthase/poly-beta-1,6-N-acetylglucosamine synthase-like glycosyltransferase